MNRWKNIFLSTALATLSACGGGGGNNDQGTTFSLIGFNSVDPQNVCQPESFISQMIIGLSDAGQSEVGDIGAFAPCITLQNNMSTQYVRVDRLYLEYFVPGAAEQPPTTSTALGVILGPQPSVSNDGGTGSGPGGSPIVGPPPFTSLPPSFTNGGGGAGAGGVAQTQTVGANVVPVEIREWLALNRLSLPETPFQMTLIARAGGVTNSGDSIVTNDNVFQVIVTEDNLITPTTGNGGTGAGDESFEEGTDFFEDGATENSNEGDESVDLDFD
jgi:hypothetical protein